MVLGGVEERGNQILKSLRIKGKINAGEFAVKTRPTLHFRI